MKKLLFLSSILLFCFSSYGQTLSAPATVESGNEFTVTVNGETNAKYVSNITLDPTGTTSAGGIFEHISGLTISSYGSSYSWALVPSPKTTFNMRVNSTITTAQTLTFKFNVNYGLNSGTGIQTGQVLTLTVQLNGLPSVFRNAAKSQVFYKDCPSGYQSDPYTYTVPANKYTASTQADADAQAQAEINANGQNTANSNLICKQVFYNAAISGSFTRNNCGDEAIPGAPVVYTVPANKYSALTQAEADVKAQNDLAVNGPNNANAVGTCTSVVFTGPDKVCTGDWGTFSLNNLPAGITVVSWSAELAAVFSSSTGNTVKIRHLAGSGIPRGKVVALLSNGTSVSKTFGFYTCGNEES